MIKEYFVVARYVAKVPNGKDPIESIYTELEADLTRLIKFDRQKEIKEMFTVIEGADLSEEDYENE